MVRNDKTGEFENLLPGIDTETLPGTIRIFFLFSENHDTRPHSDNFSFIFTKF
jgi:hypothetical protein